MVRLSTLWHKFLKYEFWPWYLMYLPVLPVYIYGVLRTRRLLYFTAVNPGIFMGGFYGERKDEILDLIPSDLKPASLVVTPEHPFELQKLYSQQIGFPLIVKPIVGERGKEVVKIETEQALLQYMEGRTDVLIQEFIDTDLELGVLYSIKPGEEYGVVTSITEKEFLTVMGDGKSSVGQLLTNHRRGKVFKEVLAREHAEVLPTIPERGKVMRIHDIGNHAKGTRFVNANRYISNEVHRVFTSIGNQLPGIQYGRFDLKVTSYSDLRKGEGIQIFELNGVSSEPGHVYDQKHIVHAWLELAKHWVRIVDIAHLQIQKGVKVTPFRTFYQAVKQHFV